MLTKGVTAYKRQLESNPMRTKMLTSATLFSLGDIICQKTEQALKGCKAKKQLKPSAPASEITQKPSSLLSQPSQHHWDKSRTLRQGTIAFFLLSPGLHLFLTKVMTKVTLKGYSRAASIGIRVGVHQACMMPFIQFTLLFASGMLMPANSMKQRVDTGKT